MRWIRAKRSKTREARRLDKERLDQFWASPEGQREIESLRDWHMHGSTL